MDNRISIFKFVSEDGEFLSGEVEIDESYFGGRRKVKRGKGAKGKIPVFGILEREGKVKVEIVKDVPAETRLMEAIKKVKRGSLIYTDKFKAYDSLVIYRF
jgi:transposase